MGGARRAGNAAVELRLLGPFEATRGSRPVVLGGPKPRALLAMLALEPGHVVSVDRLVEALWPGEMPDTAAHAVQVYVSQLRKALGTDLIPRRAPGYWLELEPERIDLHRFMRLASEGRETLAAGDPASSATVLREALALWHGPALADFVYEPFAQSDIGRLEELRTVVLEERIEADLALGRHVELLSELEGLVQAQPLRERPRAQLMLALYRSGRQADALAAYRDTRTTLVDELGIEPGPELRELEASILRQDESLLLDDAPLAMREMQFRRLATILFVDVVNAMGVGEMLDAEALGSVQRRYFETVAAAIARHGGTVEKYAGDAVMAAFGIPVSHEDDALRAARAAFDILTSVDALSAGLVRAHGVGLEVRIGLAAGEVILTATDSRQRFVAGDAVGVAARLEQAAEPGQIVVGEIVARLIDHAARLERLGSLEVESRKAPIEMFRLVELTPAAPAFERRLDAPLIGRKRELAALRSALKRAVAAGSPQLRVVVGSPGVGKSRLAAELTRRARGARTLWGRCLSYGDGITYWPLREILEQAPSCDERDAVIAALEADRPPPAPEVALLFRQFCAALAQDKPLVLVLDDVQWAEPTLLELIEQIADHGEGPLLVVTLARDELLDDQPGFLAGRENCEQIDLEALSALEAEALLDGLGGTVLESDQRSRIAETAEGNPFFVEQLLALAVEGGLVEGTLPPTVQALLAARVDRLGPGERAVLERGAVIGRDFTAGELTSLLAPEAAPTADSHLRTLSDRGFVRPRGDGAFSFRHVLVQEAVYRAAPKRLRADLHESDRRTERLAEDGGRRLGAAGTRAFQRGDIPAAKGLHERATSLLTIEDQRNRELRCNLGIILNGVGDSAGALALLSDLVSDSADAGDARIEAWARMELEYIALRRDSKAGDDLLEAATRGIPIFERAGDHRALGRAWLFIGWMHGGQWANHAAWADGAERALAHYRAAPWPTSTCLGELAAAHYWGATPVDEAIGHFEQLLEDPSTDIVGAAYVETMRGGLLAQRGDLDRGRALVEAAHATLAELGHRATARTYCSTVRGEIELMVGDGDAAEPIFRTICEGLESAMDHTQLASRSSDLAEALVLQNRLDEAHEQTEIAERHAASDDVNAQMMWRSARATVLARRGDFARAETLARQGVEIANGTDDLNRRAEAYRDLGDVLQRARRLDDAATSFALAVELFERKGNLVGAGRVRALMDDAALV